MRTAKTKFYALFTGILLSLGAQSAMAQSEADELAKAAANPVGAMIALPFQSNVDYGYGPDDKPLYVLNVQPVVPFQLNNEWNIITRTIVPLISQPGLVDGQSRKNGLGDIVETVFFSPRQSSFIWGVGPVFSLPTASDDRLGSGKWSAGPSVVLMVQGEKWAYGALVNHMNSFAGKSDRDNISQSYANPFITYTIGNGWSTTLQSDATYNWKAEDGHRQTVNAAISIAKVTKFGNQPVSLALGYRHYIETPNGKQPDNGLRFVMNFLFPK